MSDRLTTSWMWGTDDGGVNGATVDVESQQIHWYDSVGCACGDSSAVQDFATFRKSGSPIGHLADDIREEMMRTLVEVEQQRNKA